MSCEPTSQKDADKLGEALNKLAAEVRNLSGENQCPGGLGRKNPLFLDVFGGFFEKLFGFAFLYQTIS